MNSLESIIYMLDSLLDTNRKRHITGGILISASMLFGGLALTVMTIKNDENNNKKEEVDTYEQIY